MKPLKSYLLLVLIAAPTIAAFYLYYFGTPRAGIHRLTDPPAIVQQIQPLNQLITVNYTVQKIIGLQEQKIPFGTESILLMVQARVLAGVDLARLTPADVTVATDRTVTIRLPAPAILHAYVEEKETQVWDRSKSIWAIWSPLDPALEQKARLLALESAQAAALQRGILRDAQRNADRAITDLLTALGAPAVHLEHASK